MYNRLWEFHIVHEPGGVISKDPIWVASFGDGYLYMGATLPQLAWDIVRYWRDDGHIAG